MATLAQFQINGVVDTSKSVMENLNTLATSAGCWLTWDAHAGKWSVIINTTGTSVANFDDSNIIGNINVSGTGVKQLYNAVSVEFPHKDLEDELDYVDLSIPLADRFENEVDNRLDIKLDCVNDPIQAQIIGSIELKQSRVDKIVEFQTDYSKIFLKAGDLIDITTDVYGYNAKMFRVIEIEEVDEAEGHITLSIRAMEYDADVYDISGLIRTDRLKRNDIPPMRVNEEIATSNDIATGNDLGRLLLANVAAGALNKILGSASKALETTTTVDPETGEVTQQTETKFNEGILEPKYTITGPSQIKENQTVEYSVDVNYCPEEGSKLPYTIVWGSAAAADLVDVPTTGYFVFDASKQAKLTVKALADNLTEGNETFTIKINDCSTKEVTILDTYVAAPSGILTASSSVVDECQTVTFTLSNVKNFDNGVSIPWTISGVQASDILGGTMSGFFSANWADSGSDSYTVTFNQDSDQGNETLTFEAELGYDTLSQNVTLTPGLNFQASGSDITEGQTASIVWAVGGLTPSGSSVTMPYIIQGTASGKVTSPSLTGNLTITPDLAGNTGGIFNISTNDDSVYSGTQQLVVTFGPITGYGGCSVTVTINVNDNEVGDVNCQTVEVPIFWCGGYDGNDNELKSLTAMTSAIFYKPTTPGSGITVPTAVSVTKGNPSTISITATTEISASTNIAGRAYQLLTAFDSIPAGQNEITGTTTTAYGM